MKIGKLEIKNKVIWFPKHKILIIADLHLGYEEYLIEQGILIPKFMFKKMKDEISSLVRKLKPKTIIINGDLKYEFGKISQQEWHERVEILDIFEKQKIKVILIKGNHDTILGLIAKKKNVDVKDYFTVDDVCVLHGHKIFDVCSNKKIKTIIIGHEHPAISLTKEGKTEKYKCFLDGKWKGKRLIVMPSFMIFPEGSDVTTRILLSPFLKRNIKNFDVYAIGDKIYKMGKIRDIIRYR